MSSGLETLRARVLSTFVPAVAGGAAGYLYARATLPEDVFRSTALAGMYAACGAITLILSVRFVRMARMVIEDLRASRARDREDREDRDDDES